LAPTTNTEEVRMPDTVRGVIARAKDAPVETVDIVIPDPGPHDVVVRVRACGVCHTDLHYREGGINDQFPFLLGHEAAGVVESVGAAVTHPVLSGPAIERIEKSELDCIVVTDTIPLHDAARACGRIRVVSIANLLGEAIRRITNEESVSSLFV